MPCRDAFAKCPRFALEIAVPPPGIPLDDGNCMWRFPCSRRQRQRHTHETNRRSLALGAQDRPHSTPLPTAVHRGTWKTSCAGRFSSPVPGYRALVLAIAQDGSGGARPCTTGQTTLGPGRLPSSMDGQPRPGFIVPRAPHAGELDRCTLPAARGPRVSSLLRRCQGCCHRGRTAGRRTGKSKSPASVVAGTGRPRHGSSLRLRRPKSFGWGTSQMEADAP